MDTPIPNRWAVDPDDSFSAPVPNESLRTIAVQYDVFGIGGAEKVVSEQLKILCQAGYRVLLYTNAQPAKGDQPLPEGVQRRVAPSDNLEHEERYAFWQREVRENDIGACLYNSWVSGWMQFDCWALTGLGVRFVLYCHSLFTSWFSDDTADYLSRALPWAAKRASAVICTNEASARFFSTLGSSVVLFMNPLNSYLEGVNPERNAVDGRIVWVGRMSPEKRPYDLIDIMKLVHGRNASAHMVVVGGNHDENEPQPESLKAAAAAAGLADCIEFKGFASPYEHLATASLYLQTSEYEGFSMSLAEAMFFGIPCVCYDYDYLPLLAGNLGAERVPVGSIKAAADAICTILDNPSKMDSMGKAAREAYDRVAGIDLVSSYERLFAGIETGEIPEDLLYSADDGTIDDAHMYRYFLQGVRLAADERHRMQWSMQGDLDRAGGLISDLKAHIAKLDTTIEELLQSRSYRLGCALTAPYRAAKSVFKRHRKRAGQ